MVPSSLTKACNLAAVLTAFAAISLRIRESSQFYMAQASFSRRPAADAGLETGLPSAAIPNPRRISAARMSSAKGSWLVAYAPQECAQASLRCVMGVFMLPDKPRVTKPAVSRRLMISMWSE